MRGLLVRVAADQSMRCGGWNIPAGVLNREFLDTPIPETSPVRPETHGKHDAFWHMMQQGSGGHSEADRTPDPDRCRRVEWISWGI